MGLRSFNLIVEVREGEVRTIGGNVGNSVSITTYRLDANGFLANQDRVYAILKNLR